MAYSRYRIWADNTGQAADAAFLNGVEDALVKLFGVAPLTNGAMVWDGSQFRADAKIAAANIAAGAITNTEINAAAAIAKTKLAALAIVDADVSGISISKLTGYPADATKFARGDNTWAVVANTYERIAEFYYSTNQAFATVSFTSIPQTYRHLKLAIDYKGQGTGGPNSASIQFNGLSTALYDAQYLFYNNATVGAGEQGSNTSGLTIVQLYQQGAWADLTIFNYTDVLQARKAWGGTWGADWGGGTTGAGGRFVGQISGLWRGAAQAISRIDLTFPSNFAAGNRITLYGMN